MITIIDYGLGNIKAFRNVFHRLNIPIKIANSKNDLANATKIILPGVGSFDHAMTLLKNSGMRDTLDELILEKKIPVIGICVGMQLMANGSEEGNLAGLGWINKEVKKIDVSQIPYKTHLPHMGWNSINHDSSLLFNGIEENPRFYFLHSYYFEYDQSIYNAVAEYGTQFTAAFKKDNIYGVQFHPEKSHYNGIQLLKNFGTQ